MAEPQIQQRCDKPMRADARRNRARVLAAAEKVLGEQGLTAPIDEIAQAAGVGIGTVYRHFPTKQALFEAIVVAHFEPLIEKADTLLGSDDPGEAFFTFMTHMADAAGHKALASAIAESEPEVRVRRQEWSAKLVDSLESLLRAAQQAGTVRPDVTVADVRALLGGVCMAQDRMALPKAQCTRSLAILRAGLSSTSDSLTG
ncbi:MAG TPA: TetR/AcrR family transcriptional regulator [Mycobacteriales bacterium]|nr:TetR/AcrR family transcriptional regulator [Mycobacteriales bacterium]